MPEKYEREIEEILRKTSFSAPKRKRHSSGWTHDLATAWRIYTADLSPTRLLVLGMALALFGYVARAFVPELGFPLSLLSLVLLIGGLALSMSQRNARPPRRWRGQAIDTPLSDVWSDLKKRWDDWRRRRRNGPGWR